VNYLQQRFSIPAFTAFFSLFPQRTISPSTGSGHRPKNEEPELDTGGIEPRSLLKRK